MILLVIGGYGVTGIPVGHRIALFSACPIVVDGYARVTSSERTRRTYVPSHSI